MKNIFVLGVSTLILVPQFALAAPLTQAQAESLISVVQSSPGTPANAFTSLITAFSNITIAQADSLIGVVQAAPSAPANAFVNLLTSFTVDTTSTQTASTPTTVQPQVTPVSSTSPVTQNASSTQSVATTNLAHIDIIDIGAWQDGQNAPHFVASSTVPTWDAAPDGAFVSLGAVVYGPAGLVDKADILTIKASDSTQDATLNSATACNPSVCYYPYHYLFRTVGSHWITFSANGTSTTINLTAGQAQ